MKIINLNVLLLILLTVGCAHKSTVNTVANLKQSVLNSDFETAETIIKSKKFYDDEESKLLRLIELGTIRHLKKDYLGSLGFFDQAKALSDKLYTVSISKKVKAYLSSRSSDNYYGEKFERSHIRYMQALNHFILYKEGQVDKEGKELVSAKARRTHLFSARATILEWDSLLDSYKGETLGENIFKDDMMAKLFGALIHREVGTRSDINIAKQLYKDAKELLYKNYNAYSSFNSLSKKFVDDFEKLPKLKKEDIKKNYIAETEWSKTLTSYIDRQLKSLKSKERANVSILIGDRFIAAKKAKKIEFPMPLHWIPGMIPAGKKDDFLSYARTMLAVGSAVDPMIKFEIPYIDDSVYPKNYLIEVMDDQDKVMMTRPLALALPYAEVAKQSLDYRMPSIKTAIATRLAAKQLTALASSYMAGKAVKSTNKKKGGEGLGFLTSTLSYVVANQIIKNSERADTRHWHLMPANIMVENFYLKPGSYKLFLKSGNEKKLLKKLVIEKGKSYFIKNRVF